MDGFSSADFDDPDRQGIVLNGVQDPIPALAQPVAILAG